MEDHLRSGFAGVAASGHRRTRRAEEFSGLAILVLCLAVGALTLAAGADPYIPTWLWAVLLLGCLTSCVLAGSGLLRRGLQLGVYAAAVVSSWALVITMPNQGMLVVVLIVVAAVGSYVLSLRPVFGVIVLNCLVISGHLWFHGSGPQESIIAAFFYLILHLAAVFSTYALWREIQVRAELEQKTTELEAASVLLEDSARTAERLRISRELHDLIGHQLTVLHLELEAAKHREGQQSRRHIDQAADVAKELLADVRSTVGELREACPGDLRTALQRIASAVQSLDIDVHVDEEVSVDEQQVEALLRAGQEIITNAIKHGEAKELWLTVELDGAEVRLQGTNDGLAPRKVVPGHGLQGLRDRVELLGGSLAVRPHPHFTVAVSLPQCPSQEARR